MLQFLVERLVAGDEFGDLGDVGAVERGGLGDQPVLEAVVCARRGVRTGR